MHLEDEWDGWDDDDDDQSWYFNASVGVNGSLTRNKPEDDWIVDWASDRKWSEIMSDVGVKCLAPGEVRRLRPKQQDVTFH